MYKVIEASHKIISSHITKNDIVVDMTCGNGNDTLFLASISKFVYAFDIQDAAITNTYKLLHENKYDNFKIIKDSHDNIDQYINENIKGAIYNLGYLPKGDKSICTSSTSTLSSLSKLLDLLMVGGIVTIVVYPGHEEGLNESKALISFLTELDQKYYDVIKYEFINQINYPPYLLAIKKLKSN